MITPIYFSLVNGNKSYGKSQQNKAKKRHHLGAIKKMYKNVETRLATGGQSV